MERLPAFLRTGLLTDAGHLARNFPGTVQIANGSPTDGGQVRLGQAPAATLLDLGLTVGFDGLERHVDGAGSWARALERALGAPQGCVRLMAFANAPGSGLTLHHDVHDQLLIHLQGSKTFLWRRNEHVATPSERFSHGTRPARGFGADYAAGFPPTASAVVESGLEEVELRPGSVLFLPGGTWHTTSGQTEQTLSVAVIAEVPSQNQVLVNLLRWHLAQAPEGRARAYRGWSDDPSTALGGLQQLAGELATRLPDLDLEHAFAAWELDGSFAKPALYPSTVPFQRFVRLPFARLQTRPSDDGEGLLVRVRCGLRTNITSDTTLLTLPASQAVLDWIGVCHRAFTTDELQAACPAFRPTSWPLSSLPSGRPSGSAPCPPTPGNADRTPRRRGRYSLQELSFRW